MAKNLIGIVLCAAGAIVAASHGTSTLHAQSGYTTTAVPTGSSPYDVAVNPATNKIYVSNLTSQNVSVLDGTTNAVVATIDTPLSANPGFIAVNPTTNRIYVSYAAFSGGSLVEGVMMIDGASDTLAATFAAGHASSAMAVDPIRNLIYVPNGTVSNTVSVIDGAAGGGDFLPAPIISVPGGAAHLAVNPVTNKIYVTGPTTLTIIDGATSATTELPTGRTAAGVAVNPATNKIYLVGAGGFGVNGQVTVLDGSSNAMVTLTIDGDPGGYIAVDSTSNKIYVTSAYNPDDTYGSTLTVIDGASNATADVTVGKYPGAIAVDPSMHKVYVANGELIDGGDNSDPASDVSVIEGLDNSVIATVPAGSLPFAVAVNPFSHKAYTADFNSNDVTVIIPPTVGNTPTGSNVSVTPASGLTVTFNQVAAPGDTTAVAVTAPPPPAGFQVDGVIYDISTTATYVPPVTVCFPYSPSDSSPRLNHYETGTWVDRTVSVDSVNHIVCGQVSSLSPFAVLQPLVSPHFTAATPPLTVMAGAPYGYTFSATGSPAPTFALASGAPSWLSVGPASGLVSGTPPTGTTTFAYSVTAANGVAPDATVGPFVVSVVAPPQFTTAAPPLTATQGVQYAYTFSANGLPAPGFALVSGAPTWLSIGSTSGLVAGTPPSGTTSFTYAVTATNGIAPDATAGPFVVTVSPPTGNSADLSIAVNGPATAARDSTVTYTIVVTNRGPLQAVDGAVAMVVGPGATLLSADPAPVIRGVGLWRFETLDAGASATFSLSVKLSRAGTIVGIGTVGSRTPDKTLTNNIATVRTAVR